MNADRTYQHAKRLLKRYGKADKSTYVNERKILWIRYQPLFNKCMEIESIGDEEIEAIAKEINPEYRFILIAGGNTEIEMHRDAKYGDRNAATINLGGEAHFEHEDTGGQRLKHGDITRFDCKKLHGILEADQERIAIMIWKKNAKW